MQNKEDKVVVQINRVNEERKARQEGELGWGRRNSEKSVCDMLDEAVIIGSKGWMDGFISVSGEIHFP